MLKQLLGMKSCAVISPVAIGQHRLVSTDSSGLSSLVRE